MESARGSIRSMANGQELLLCAGQQNTRTRDVGLPRLLAGCGPIGTPLFRSMIGVSDSEGL